MSAYAKSAPTKCRNICFTIHENPREWYAHFKTIDMPDWCKYLVFQVEVAPETKREHIQGYVELTGPRTWKSIKGLLGRDSAHLEARRGSAKQASDYCKKDDTRVPDLPFVERGELSEQGRRTDLEAAARLVMERKEEGIMDLAQEAPALLVRNFRGLQQLNAIVNAPMRRICPTIFFLHGPPGCGKSMWAHNAYPNAYVCEDTQQGWFDGYFGQTTVIFDEFTGNIPLHLLLKILDYWPLRVPIKGGFVPMRAHTFVFTSNQPPEGLYQSATQYAAWMRRISEFGKVLNEDDIKLENAATQETESVADGGGGVETNVDRL